MRLYYGFDSLGYFVNPISVLAVLVVLGSLGSPYSPKARGQNLNSFQSFLKEQVIYPMIIPIPFLSFIIITLKILFQTLKYFVIFEMQCKGGEKS